MAEMEDYTFGRPGLLIFGKRTVLPYFAHFLTLIMMSSSKSTFSKNGPALICGALITNEDKNLKCENNKQDPKRL